MFTKVSLTFFCFGVFLFLGFSSLKVVVNSFVVNYQGSDIKLEWKVANEDDATMFEISRKKNEEGNYIKLGEVSSIKAGSYSFIDDNLYRSAEANQNFTYRLTIKSNTGAVVNYFASINHSPTAVQRSWGSIKSMFK